ncbi:MAG: leucyl aminopeptidase [Francisellaceae bacterium]|jgi:leucyl aminopeptidase
MVAGIFLTDKKINFIPIIPLDLDSYSSWLKNSTACERKYLETVNFEPKEHKHIIIFNPNGNAAKILVGFDQSSMWCLSSLYKNLPDASYYVQDEYNLLNCELAYLGFSLGSYVFDKYKKYNRPEVYLYLPEQFQQVRILSESICMVRDLVNTPAEDLGTKQLSSAVKELANKYSAQFEEIVGDDLLTQNYPTIHAVGRASINLPRLLDLKWGNEENPKLTLVGKGVSFDTGGLDVKPAGGMLIMHKDMGGSAHVIGLANLIMAHNLPVRLRVLIPAVENSIGSNAYRPSDVIKTRNGKTVQVLNTDAEGRLILCDALAEASSENPDMIIDMATLTGASRVALGLEVPAVFSNNSENAANLLECSNEVEDPIWQMPLYQPYKRYLNNPIADMGNISTGNAFGGAILAALFLESFIDPEVDWLHLDLGAWNATSQPGRPIGGECMSLRCIYKFLENKYSI